MTATEHILTNAALSTNVALRTFVGTNPISKKE
jgi:hypothetical protein